MFFNLLIYRVFFFNETAPPEIYTYVHTLSRHDALPISGRGPPGIGRAAPRRSGAHRSPGRASSSLSPSRRVADRAPAVGDDGLAGDEGRRVGGEEDRKSTRLNSSH